MPKETGGVPPRTLISRRDILKSTVVLAASAPLTACFGRGAHVLTRPSPPRTWPSYLLRREVDELYVELLAIGYRERKELGRRFLQRIADPPDAFLVFRLPPQHFIETAIPVQGIPASFPEETLSTIELLPSQPCSLVFRVPDRTRIDLRLSALLEWHTFELVLPDLKLLGAPYDLDVPSSSEHPFTRIEMPWGIELAPIGQYGSPPRTSPGAADRPVTFLWEQAPQPLIVDEWAEMWTTTLRNSTRRNDPIPFEVLSVRGFQRGTTTGDPATGDLKVTYTDAPGATTVERPATPNVPGRTVPLRNLDRIEIAASLSRRFPYTGKPGPPTIESGLLRYDSPLNPQNTCLSACYAEGRTVAVGDFRLSPRGGWLTLDGTWAAFPGCALTGWSHIATLGRDDQVRLVRAGFLFPFGNDAELIVISERAFIRDEHGHFIAVLIKQAFLQVPQPNVVPIDHAESIFRSASVVSRRTPPLDLPPGGDPATYADYDFFLPTVDGQPFAFEHVGSDWSGAEHSARMPMIFVSNKARRADGLIWEPGSPPSTQQAAACGEAIGGGTPDATHAIPRTGDGLRVVDKAWNAAPHRFASYGGALIAVARSIDGGDTSQRIEWAEWTRGPVPDVRPMSVAIRPFIPRTRTFKGKIQGISQFSAEETSSLATFRDTRFTDLPLLDPEPNAPPDIYRSNLPPDADDPASEYLYLLETRDLIAAPAGASSETPSAAAARIRRIYFGTSTAPSSIPDGLFMGIDNEVRFGTGKSSETTGGLSVPDTHASTVTRRVGVRGDATFNLRRWPGYTTDQRTKLQGAQRLDYAAFRLAHRAAIDVTPFDQSRTPLDVQALSALARSLMGFAPVVATRAFGTTSDTRPAPSLSLGDLFGGGAQLLPGLSFADLFRRVPVSGASAPAVASGPPAPPMAWKLRVTGIDWLFQLIGSGPDQLSMAEFLAMAKAQSQNLTTSTPIAFGIEAALDWSNDAFQSENFGPVEFKPSASTGIEIQARARMELGLAGLPTDLAQLQIDPGKAQMSARASLRDFSLLLFDAIEVVFSEVTFTLSADGRKQLTTRIADVRLTGELGFINQLSKILGGLGSDLGVDIDISPARVVISQTLRFPPDEGEPLLLGPAQITNLALKWGVMIPLIGRDVLTASFAVSSREKPLTIFVPPWYGGKAHVLLEVTTRGVRMLEVSMEYGALIPIHWGIASGEASLMAGIFYMVEHTTLPDNRESGKVVFKAFVKAEANLDVLGIIHFCGVIYIALGYVEEPTRKLIVGEATVSVSIKIGLLRVSYSFTASHVEESRGAGSQPALLASLTPQAVGPVSDLDLTMPHGDTGDAFLFGPRFDNARRKAFERILDGYLM